MNLKGVNIAFSGSGTNYVSFVGAYKSLWYRGYRPASLAGVSGGAIIAGAIASGYSEPKDLEELVLSTLPGINGLIDYSWNPFRDRGVIKGDKLEREFRERFASSFHNAELDCHIVTANHTLGVEEVFSRSHGNEFFVESIRASMSLPFVFKPKKIGKYYYIDGGVVNNFPIDIFKNDYETVGFYFKKTKRLGKSEDNSLISSAKRTINMLMDSRAIENIEDAKNSKAVPLKGFSDMMKLNMTPYQAKKLIDLNFYITEKRLFGNTHSRLARLLDDLKS